MPILDDEAEATLRSLLIDGQLAELRRTRDNLKHKLADSAPVQLGLSGRTHPLAVETVR